MTLMPPSQATRTPVGILAQPLSVKGVDDSDTAGHVPRQILITGTQIVIPYWLFPEPKDELWLIKRQNGIEQRLYTVIYPMPLSVPFLYFALTPQHLATNGVAFLYYKIWKGSGGNDDPSPERQLTIDHTPLFTLPEPLFRDATLWGYLNNNTNPPLTSGATIRIRPLSSIAVSGDIAVITWRGYSTLNGSGTEVAGAYGRWEKPLSNTDITNGFNHVVPFQSHISLLVDNDSAVVVCQLFRGKQIIAESDKGLVKVDQVTPGQIGPSGLNTQGETTMAIQLIPKKQRPISITASDAGPFADIAVDTLADGFIAKSVFDNGTLYINFTRTIDELPLDDIDVRYREKGESVWIDYPDTIKLGPIDQRPVGTIPLPLVARTFAEKATSLGPTVWELMITLYKGGGGNTEDSNPLEFKVDQTPPVNTKNPPRKIKPTPAPVFVNATPLPTRTIDKNWIDANPNMKFTVNTTYFGRRLDDKLTVWLLDGTQKIQVYNNSVPATGEFDIISNELLKFQNGRVNISFRLNDWLDNEGEESIPTPILTLALPQPPVVNKAPLVPETDPDYTEFLYYENLADGVEAKVENSSIEHAQTGDQVFLTITDRADVTNYVETAKQSWDNANLTFDLLSQDLFQIFADADEPKEVTIHCEIQRPGIPNAVSPPAPVTLALDIAGVKPPNPPDTNNPDLQLPVVTGASNIPNTVLATDRDKPGKFEVTNALPHPDILPEHTVKCYLGSSTIPFAVFSPLVPVSNFDVRIPANIMATLTPPSDVARYTIQKTGVDKNVNKSLPQTVVVNQIPIILPAPTIRIRNATVRDYIECFAMISPTSKYVLGLQIPKDSLLPPDTVITAHFEAHRNSAGTDLIAGTKDSKDYTIAPVGTPDVAPVGSDANFKAAQPVHGAIAFGKYWYTADGGKKSSNPIIKPLDTINSSRQYCDSTEAPPGP